VQAAGEQTPPVGVGDELCGLAAGAAGNPQVRAEPPRSGPGDEVREPPMVGSAGVKPEIQVRLAGGVQRLVLVVEPGENCSARWVCARILATLMIGRRRFRCRAWRRRARSRTGARCERAGVAARLTACRATAQWPKAIAAATRSAIEAAVATWTMPGRMRGSAAQGPQFAQRHRLRSSGT
jgi:hypothetical protein